MPDAGAVVKVKVSPDTAYKLGAVRTPETNTWKSVVLVYVKVRVNPRPKSTVWELPAAVAVAQVHRLAIRGV